MDDQFHTNVMHALRLARDNHINRAQWARGCASEGIRFAHSWTEVAHEHVRLARFHNRMLVTYKRGVQS